MKIGLKIYSTNSQSFPILVQLYKSGLIKYVEIYIVPGHFHSESLSILKGIPIIFHAPNYNHGFSFTRDDQVFKTSLATIEKFVDFFQEKRIIIHPGYILSRTDSVATLIKSIRKHTWLDIILENVPAIALDNKTKLVASSVEEFGTVLKETKVKFCLDFGHAAAAARFYSVNKIKFIKKLMRFTPYMFHICDSHDQDTDSHLHLGEGDMPLETFRKMIHDEYVSLETPKKDFLTLAEDIENIKTLNAL